MPQVLRLRLSGATVVAQQPRPMPYVDAAVRVIGEAARHCAAGCSMLPRQEFKVNYEVRPEEAGFQPKERKTHNTYVHWLLFEAIQAGGIYYVHILRGLCFQPILHAFPVNSHFPNCVFM